MPVVEDPSVPAPAPKCEELAVAEEQTQENERRLQAILLLWHGFPVGYLPEV
jgi:hypothetical protein